MSRNLAFPTQIDDGYAHLYFTMTEPGNNRSYEMSHRLMRASLVNIYDAIQNNNAGILWNEIVNNCYYPTMQTMKQKIRGSVPLSIDKIRLVVSIPIVSVANAGETFLTESDANTSYSDAVINLQSTSKPEVYRQVRIENFPNGHSLPGQPGVIDITTLEVYVIAVGYSFQYTDGTLLQDFHAVSAYYVA